MPGDPPIRILVWQWGRFGAGPRLAMCLAEGMSKAPGIAVSLSLSTGAEILRGAAPPRCDLPVDTYASRPGFIARVLRAPFSIAGLARRIHELRPAFAICVQPGPLDLLMAVALRRLKIPFMVLVHDADHHPGDGLPSQMWLQRMLCRLAVAVAALTAHVGDRLIAQNLAGTPDRPLILLRHPPVHYAAQPREERAAGTFRLLSFGRLLPYKGLDLLAACLTRLGPRPGLTIRVIGSGPDSAELAALRALPDVTVENRWVPEDEVGAPFQWADAVILPYREASQSGVAAVALAAGCRVIATRVGGLAEQLADEPLAILCDVNADSLVEGVRRWLEGPAVTAPPSADDAWAEVGHVLADRVRALILPGSSATAAPPSPSSLP